MQPADTENKDLLSLYQEIILDHGKAPRNTGLLEGYDCRSDGKNPLCGDKVTVTASYDDAGQVDNLKFDGKGCAISIASASMMTEAVKGLTIEEAETMSQAVNTLCREELSPREMTEQFGEKIAARLESLAALSGVRQFPARVKCANLPWQTLVACLRGKATASTER